MNHPCESGLPVCPCDTVDWEKVYTACWLYAHDHKEILWSDPEDYTRCLLYRLYSMDELIEGKLPEEVTQHICEYHDDLAEFDLDLHLCWVRAWCSVQRYDIAKEMMRIMVDGL